MGTTQIASKWQRQRREHTRSRTGCRTCKSRRIRCDERRPNCINCESTGRQCEYTALILPIHDKRLSQPSVPGQQIVWQAKVERQLPETVGDPFNSFPIELPFKSREVLRHFFHVWDQRPRGQEGTDEALASCPSGVIQLNAGRAFQNALQDPIQLSGFLVAAVSQLSGITDGLHGAHGFSPTFYYHMNECLKYVKEWVQPANSRGPLMRCINYIAILAIIDTMAHRPAPAEAHVEGLLALLALHDSRGIRDEDEQDLRTVHSLLLVVRNFFAAAVVVAQGLRMRPQDEEIMRAARLLCQLPFFFSVSPHSFKLVDAPSSIATLRWMMIHMNATHQLPESLRAKVKALPMLAFVYISDPKIPRDSQLEILIEDTDEGVKRPSRAAFATACGFYLFTTLWLWQGDELAESRMLAKQFLLLKDDIERTAIDEDTDQIRKDFWVWEIFVAAFGLTALDAQLKIYTGNFAKVLNEKELSVFGLRKWFLARLRRWAEVTGVTEWKEARQSLENIVWPEKFKGEQIAEDLWEEALDGRPQ